MDSAEVMYRLFTIKAARAAEEQVVSRLALESHLLEFENVSDARAIQWHKEAIFLAVGSGANGVLPTVDSMFHLQTVMMRDYDLAGYPRGADLTMVNVNNKRFKGADTGQIMFRYRALFEGTVFRPSMQKDLLSDPRVNPMCALAQLHLEFEEIHGLWDGNGRVGRLLLHWWCAYLGIPYIVLLATDRDRYCQCLADRNIHGLAQLFKERSKK